MPVLNPRTSQSFMELAPVQRKRLREIEKAFHVRAFGEEMARVNFMPVKRRRDYLERCHQRTQKAGV